MSYSKLIREYAIEPCALNNFKDLRLIEQGVGVGEGRLVVRCPDKWERMVYDSLSQDCPDLEKKRIEESLCRLKTRLVSRPQDWEPKMNWRENAVRLHQADPFDAIITLSADDQRYFLPVDRLDSVEPLWQKCREGKFPRTPGGIVGAIKPLLRYSSECTLIDPYFVPEDRFIDVLRYVLRVLPAKKGSEYQVVYHTSNIVDKECFRQKVEKEIKLIIPSGIILTIYRWKKRKQGDKMHPRYILTNLGGVNVDCGLDTGKLGTFTDISLLDTPHFEVIRKSYQYISEKRGNMLFELAEDPIELKPNQ